MGACHPAGIVVNSTFETGDNSMMMKQRISSGSPIPAVKQQSTIKVAMMEEHHPRTTQNEVDFDHEEVAMLQVSFSQLIRNNYSHVVAKDIVERVSHEVKGAADIYEAHKYSLNNEWSSIGLGMVLLSGIERCLLRLENRPSFHANIDRLVIGHSQRMGVSGKMMSDAVRASWPVLMCHLNKVHAHSSENFFYPRSSQDDCLNPDPAITPPSNDCNQNACKLCNSWEKMINFIISQFEQADTPE